MIRPARLLALCLVTLLGAGCELFFSGKADCADGKLNGLETDVDCGGASCAGCAADQLCLADGDCASRVCTVNRCAPPSCADAVRNGDETDVDCGGSCGACAAMPSCTNGMRDGAETDVDCGGGSCTPCLTNAACVRDVDCQSLGCADGKCSDGCGAPLLACNLACVDPFVDPGNCGGCGVICGGGGQCVGGQCALVCLGGTQACGGGCVDPASNPAHCGGCNQPCGPADICVGGMCLFPCVPGQVPCGAACVSLDRDPLNCGGCNQPCGPGDGCVGGQCTPISACVMPLSICSPADAGMPSCVDPRYDPANCGGCGVSCDGFPHAGGACVDAGCVLGGCQPGFANCNTNPLDGCEAELSVDQGNCGMCGVMCSAGETCALGRCCGAIPAGTYQATCSNCEACNGVLSCLCEDSMQVLRPAAIPLGCALGITNCNGALLCNGC
jgi:hypothetical protein